MFSGLGYIVGSTVAKAAKNWHWGIRVTPFFGVICLLFLVIKVKEPERGQAEKEIGANIEAKRTSYKDDIIYLVTQ